MGVGVEHTVDPESPVHEGEQFSADSLTLVVSDLVAVDLADGAARRHLLDQDTFGYEYGLRHGDVLEARSPFPWTMLLVKVD